MYSDSVNSETTGYAYARSVKVFACVYVHCVYVALLFAIWVCVWFHPGYVLLYSMWTVCYSLSLLRMYMLLCVCFSPHLKES